MVNSDELSSDALTKAMLRGDFYSSSGVMLDQVIRAKDRIELSVNEKETKKELASKFLFGHPVKKGEPWYIHRIYWPRRRGFKKDKRTFWVMRS